MKHHILAIDQSTAGTKAFVLDDAGSLLARADRPHRQIVSPEGWVSHDAMEIYNNVLAVVGEVVEKSGIAPDSLAAVGISNQRETALVWDVSTGLPVEHAVVWQCARGQAYCTQVAHRAEEIRQRTGLQLSPYFSAAKIAWLLDNAGSASKSGLRAGTMDSWLLYKLAGVHKTDYSNASRTQLFNIHTLSWDAELCTLFGVDAAMLPQVCDSNSHFGSTDFAGFLPVPIPIYAVMGDSHAALYGQGCHQPGMVKITYGTGSSIMMHTGEKPVISTHGLVTSLAWGISGRVDYVLEGNINYSAAVMKWLVEDVQLLEHARDAGALAEQADPADTSYLVPAFTGLGAPHWKSDAKAMLCGMTRMTGKAEIVRAAEDSIAHQIADVVDAMCSEAPFDVEALRADGGATGDGYLMQFQSDILGLPVWVPDTAELSAFGAAYMAGMKAGLYSDAVWQKAARHEYAPQMEEKVRTTKRAGWQQALKLVCGK